MSGAKTTPDAAAVTWQETLPWQHSDLAAWDICGMNHYHVNGVRLLFVAITRGGICLRAEGPDAEVWKCLRSGARSQIREAPFDFSHRPGDGL